VEAGGGCEPPYERGLVILAHLGAESRLRHVTVYNNHPH